MYIEYNPEDVETKVEHHICEYHKENPGKIWPGCTCTSTYSQSYKKREKGFRHSWKKYITYSGCGEVVFCKECGTALGVKEDDD